MEPRNRRSRKRWKAFLASPIVMVVAAALAAFMTRAAWLMSGKEAGSTDRYEQASADLARLEAEKADLSGKVAYLSTEKGVETELRSKYHAVVPGESVAVIVDERVATDSASGSAARARPDGWWSVLLRFAGL